jgi:hypothetical protein
MSAQRIGPLRWMSVKRDMGSTNLIHKPGCMIGYVLLLTGLDFSSGGDDCVTPYGELNLFNLIALYNMTTTWTLPNLAAWMRVQSIFRWKAWAFSILRREFLAGLRLAFVETERMSAASVDLDWPSGHGR